MKTALGIALLIGWVLGTATMALNLRQVEGRWYMDNNLEEAPPKAEAGKEK